MFFGFQKFSIQIQDKFNKKFSIFLKIFGDS